MDDGTIRYLYEQGVKSFMILQLEDEARVAQAELAENDPNKRNALATIRARAMQAHGIGVFG